MGIENTIKMFAEQKVIRLFFLDQLGKSNLLNDKHIKQICY